MKAVLSSASEAEIGALFENTKSATILRTTLEEMGYPQPQPPTPVQTDNSTACGIANDNIKQQRSRTIDMRFYRVRDPVKQQQFHIYWGPGKLNLADYYSKHHPPAHHQQMRSIYLYTGTEDQCSAVLAGLRGCVKPAPMLGSPQASRSSH
jgi:predicted transposase YdaD